MLELGNEGEPDRANLILGFDDSEAMLVGFIRCRRHLENETRERPRSAYGKPGLSRKGKRSGACLGSKGESGLEDFDGHAEDGAALVNE